MSAAASDTGSSLVLTRQRLFHVLSSGDVSVVSDECRVLVSYFLTLDSFSGGEMHHIFL